MDSSIPPPPSDDLRKLRPWHLVPAMALSWFIGVQGLLGGSANVMFLHEGRLPDLPTLLAKATDTGQTTDFMNLMRAVELDAMYRSVQVTFPLAIAMALLSGLLVIASGLAMGGRPGARSLCLQALMANAILAVISYALTQPSRGLTIDTIVDAARTLPPQMPQRDVLVRPDAMWWVQRMRLVFGELGTLALAAFSLTRPRTRLFFEAMERATASAEEP